MEESELRDRIKRLKRYKSRLDEMCQELEEIKQWFEENETPNVDCDALDSSLFGATLDADDAAFEVEELIKHYQRLLAQ